MKFHQNFMITLIKLLVHLRMQPFKLPFVTFKVIDWAEKKNSISLQLLRYNPEKIKLHHIYHSVHMKLPESNQFHKIVVTEKLLVFILHKLTAFRSILYDCTF